MPDTISATVTSGNLSPDSVTVTYGGKPNRGTKKDKRLHENKDSAASGLTEALATATEMPEPQWRGVLVVEGRPTGDGRQFASDSINWPDPQQVPLILQWQKETSHGGDHDVTVSVGRIWRIWRDGDGQIWGEGTFDTSPDAAEAQRRVGDGYAGGISVNADDITDADVEYVYKDPPDDEDDGDLLRSLFGPRPDLVLYHSGRLRGATLCDVPAFVEAVIHSTADAEALAASVPPPPLRPVLVHESTTSAAIWDRDLHWARLRSGMPRDVADQAFAWIGTDHPQVTRDQCEFLHHEISEGGIPGPANLTACLEGIVALQDVEIPAGDKLGVYRHLAAHLADAHMPVPPYEPQHALLAHAWQGELWRPPRDWFEDPKLSVKAPILVSDDGRVYGLATEWAECHIGMSGECILPPRESYHDRFLTGTITCDNGEEIAVGQITAGIGHAPMNGVSAARAAEHYDNTEAVVADVMVGNGKLGIWVAGAVRPWAQTQRVHALKASGQVSPDWRRFGGKLKMVGLLTVNVSGYQVPRVRTLVASGKIQAMIASGFSTVHIGDQPGPSEDLRAVMDSVRARVLGE